MRTSSAKKGQAGKRRSGPSSSRRRILVLVALALLAALAGGLLLGRCKRPAPLHPEQNATQEGPSADFARRLDKTDQALRRTLKALRLEPVQPPETEERRFQEAPYTFTSLRLPKTDRQVLHDRLVKELAADGSGAQLSKPEADVWELRVDIAPTHRLLLTPEEEAPPPPEDKPKPTPPPAKAGKARVAIVIDDMGEDPAIARDLAGLKIPVAFSIWPDASHHEGVLKIAKAAGREVLIHLPMEPKGYPKVNPGPHPLLLSMQADQVRATVTRALERVPGAIGVNNHMGSAYTEWRTGMRVALEVLQEP